MNSVDLQVNGVGAISAPLPIILLLTLISFLPAILVTMTSFTRIAIVFHFLRQALGTQEAPSNQILIGLALFLTVFVMAPVGEQINQAAVQPALRNELTVTQALEPTFFSDAFGMCVDRFGTPWMVVGPQPSQPS